MLAAENMLKSLETLKEDQTESYQNHNGDHNCGTVLEFCCGDTVPRHKFRYADGTEEVFSFDI